MRRSLSASGPCRLSTLLATSNRFRVLEELTAAASCRERAEDARATGIMRLAGIARTGTGAVSLQGLWRTRAGGRIDSIAALQAWHCYRARAAFARGASRGPTRCNAANRR